MAGGGTLHAVGEYAPEGYRLERTDYEGDSTVHRFVALEGPAMLLVSVGPGEDEAAVLAAFKASHAKRASKRKAVMP